jgi:AcrR family transcriptional regulator
MPVRLTRPALRLHVVSDNITLRPNVDNVNIMPKKPRKSYHHADLRPALLAAARRMLERGGPEAVSLREVARRAGVSHNAPYRHFADRAALLAALAEQGFGELAGAVAESAKGAAGPKRLAAMGAAYVRFALDRPGLFRLMFGGAVRGADHPALADAARRAYAGLTGEAPQNPLRAWALVHGLAHLLLDGQITSVGGDRAAAHRLVTEILGG